MKYYNITQSPLKIYGLAVADSVNRQFYKLPKTILEQMPQYDYLGRRATGGRVRFCTDSSNLTIRMTLNQAKEDINIPLSGSAGADIYLGKGIESEYLGYIAPNFHVMEEISVEKTFSKKNTMEIVTINLPRNDHLLSMEIGVDDTARVEESPTYTITSPIVFYGSSITEGGCASRAGNAYTSIVCRWLDADYRNFGFSGSARGEQKFARYLASLTDMSVLVYDYDHNANDVKQLSDTHEAFFQTVRRAHPDLPILIMSRPDTDKTKADAQARKEVIYATYSNAQKQGDEKVWFLDGETFFGTYGRAECTVDGTHPNALGFMRMAEKVYTALSDILDIKHPINFSGN